MDLGQPTMLLPNPVATHLYPIGSLHWVSGRIYRVHSHGPITPEGTTRVNSLIALDQRATTRWVHEQITAEITALRSAILDERPVAFSAHLTALEWPILWTARRRPGEGIDAAFYDLLAAVSRRPADAVNAINRLSAALNAAME